MARRSGMLNKPLRSNIIARSISTSPLPDKRPNETPGLRSLPACTRSASATPSSAKAIRNRGLLSNAISTAASDDSGADNKALIRSCTSGEFAALATLCALSTLVAELPIRSLLSSETRLSPPSVEKLAQPSNASDSKPINVRARAGAQYCEKKFIPTPNENRLR